MPIQRLATNRVLVEFTDVQALERRAKLGPGPTGGFEAISSDAKLPWGAVTLPPQESRLHPWDEAHRALADPHAIGLESAPSYAEPDFVQAFPYQGPDDVGLESFGSAGPCFLSGPDDFWPPKIPQSSFPFAWHLSPEFSGLKAARERVGEPTGRRIRIAILDTGYDPEHVTLPEKLLKKRQWNFVENNNDARDPNHHFPSNQPGHGTATLAILAGRRIHPSAFPSFDDWLGGAPHAEVVPVRIADSVIHFKSQAMAQGIEYAITAGCDVISISMGGVPARSWAQAVNRAYEAGIAIFAAAGNRIGISPPSTIVYPARFNRVVAVCGVTADKNPYYREGLHRKMQGCFGPPGKMRTAIAAYTPNMPWAILGCHGLVTVDGGGTSSATPQAAAAAALWLQYNPPPSGVAGWQKVEAVRNALFQSADRDVANVNTYYGQGLLRASQALDVPFRTDLPSTPPDAVSFRWLRLLGALEAAAPEGRELMFEVEALQIYEQSPDLQKLTGGADYRTDSLDSSTLKQLIAGLAASPYASNALRDHLGGLLRRP
jgi:Subtilase family